MVLARCINAQSRLSGSWLLMFKLCDSFVIFLLRLCANHDLFLLFLLIIKVMHLNAILLVFWLIIMLWQVREVVVLEKVVIWLWHSGRVLLVSRRVIAHPYCSLRLFLLIRGSFKFIDLVKVYVCSVVLQLQLIDSNFWWFFRLWLLLMILLNILVLKGVIVFFFVSSLFIIINFSDLIHGHDLFTLINIPFGPSLSMVDLLHLQEIVQMHLCLTSLLNFLQ